MQRKYQHINFFLLFILSLILMSWGYSGHNKINHRASLSFSPEMEQFLAWTITLTEHASDADDRKETDPNEVPRHYIDIDNYPEFLAAGRIPQTYDSVVAIYGEDFVIGQGILPWATIATYDSLVNCFLRHDWAKAVLFASDLGHYIADAHMPLHITRNYNGQYSGNYGIHWRYESEMIDLFLEDIDYSGDDITLVTDVNNYIFDQLYSNYIYADSVIAADDYARGIAGNTTSYEYKEALWDKTHEFTIRLFSHASLVLAELIYSAWTEAGKPLITGSGIFSPSLQSNIIHLHITPNPFTELVLIQFTLPESSPVCIDIVDVNGIIEATLADSYLSKGNHKIKYDLTRLPAGIHFISIQAGKFTGVRKVIKLGTG